MKDTFYFQHDYDPTTDLKVGAMLTEYGANGYGLFWRLVEILHSEETHKIPHKKFVFIALAKQMLTDVEQIETFVKSCIEVYELFESDGEYFWSNRVLRNIEKRNEIKEKRANAGKASAEKRKEAKEATLQVTDVQQNSTSVEHNLTHDEQISTKENKVKESKENIIIEESEIPTQPKKDSSKKFVPPTEQEILIYLKEYCKEKNKMFRNFENESEKIFNHYESNGWKTGKNPVKDWKACVRGWVARSQDYTIIKPQTPLFEKKNIVNAGNMYFNEDGSMK